MERFASAVLGRPLFAVVLVLIVTGALAIPASRVRIDPSVEGMILGDDPDLVYYRAFLERYGSDEIVIIAIRTPRLFNAETLDLVKRISDRMASIELEGSGEASGPVLIDKVVSLSTVLHLRGERAGDGESTLVTEPLLVELPTSAAESRILWERAVGDPLYLGNFLSDPEADSPEAPLTTLVLGRIVDRPGDLEYRQVIQERVAQILAEELQGAGIETVHVAGIPILKATLGQMAQNDLPRLVPIYWALIFVILFLIFRQLPAVAMPLLTVSLALVWTLGVLTLCGSTLNVASAVLRPLILVIGVATTMHLFSYYLGEASSIADVRSRARNTLVTVGRPCLLASLTTAIGFLSLAASAILPIREVGLYSAFGVMAAWLIGVILIPISMLRFAPPSRDRGQALGSRLIDSLLTSLASLTDRFRWPVLFMGMALVVIAVAGIFRIRADTELLAFLGPDHELARAYAFVSEQIGGADSLEVTVRAHPGDLLEPRLLRRIEAFQDWLEAQPEIGHTFSFVDYVKRVNQELYDGDPARFAIPDSKAQVANALQLIDGSVDLDPFIHPYWESVEEVRVIARRIEGSPSSELVRLIARVENHLAAHVVSDPALLHRRGHARTRATDDVLEPGQVGARVTGVTLLFTNMVESLIQGQKVSLLLAFTAIWVVMTVVLRSIPAGALVMIPNLFPILMILGFMGYAGITLNIGTVMIGSVCIGIAVDDTIHFMHRYRLRLAAIGDAAEAVRVTMREVGRPIVATSAALAVGFAVLRLSKFQPNADFGLLSSITMVLALLGDLVLLPACLLAFRPRLPVGRRTDHPA